MDRSAKASRPGNTDQGHRSAARVVGISIGKNHLQHPVTSEIAGEDSR